MLKRVEVLDAVGRIDQCPASSSRIAAKTATALNAGF